MFFVMFGFSSLNISEIYMVKIPDKIFYSLDSISVVIPPPSQRAAT